MCNNGDLNSIIYRLPWSVEHLSLTKSHIHYVKSQSFGELKHLSKLSLDGNNITRIQQFAFKGLRKLQELSIQHTSLDRLDKFAFSGLQNVTAILLAHNKISSIEEYAFAGTSHVRLVLLAHNPLHVIKSNAFSGLRNVEHLILPSGIRVVEPDAFRGLDSVGLLKLAFMDLAELEAFTFRGLNHVHVLAVQQSDLGTVRARAFQGLADVGTLNLINNKIDYVEELTIERENRVKIVRLVGNHVLKLPSTSHAIRVRASDNFTVVGNHFPCDCATRFLLRLDGALANRTSYNFSLKNYCISPLKLNGKPINEMRRTACSGGDDNADHHASNDATADSSASSAPSALCGQGRWGNLISNSHSWSLAASSPIRLHLATFVNFLYNACFFYFHRAWTSAALRY